MAEKLVELNLMWHQTEAIEMMNALDHSAVPFLNHFERVRLKNLNLSILDCELASILKNIKNLKLEMTTST